MYLKKYNTNVLLALNVSEMTYNGNVVAIER